MSMPHMLNFVKQAQHFFLADFEMGPAENINFNEHVELVACTINVL
jgi:hypothetical protein